MRSTVILGLLIESDDPVRGRELWTQANEDERFQKANGEGFWYEDFPWYMKGLIEQGVVTKIKERNKVWYVITEKGLKRYMQRSEPKLLKAFIKRRLRYNIGRNVRYYDEDRELLIAQLTKELKDGGEYTKLRYYRELVKAVAYRLEHGYEEMDEDKVAIIHERVGWNDEWEAKLQIDAPKLVQRRRGHSEREAAGLGYSTCYMCGGWIHRKDVVKVADELAERLGVETGSVCCSCYDKLMKGGECEVASYNL